MKTPVFFLLFYLSVQSLYAQHKKASVLFIGNSYTYVNNLPLLLDSMANAGGDTLIWDMSAPGGYTLQMHSAYSVTLSKIQSQQWDYVVLQEQSQLPSFEPESVDSTTIPYALILDSLIHANNPCTQTVFYETWGRKYGDASNCNFYPPVCTYEGMQQRLLESYKLMADTCHAVVAPVGEAFRKSIAADSAVNLYQADYSHPSLEGSFLAASVFYNIIFHKSALGNSFDPGVTQLPASAFQLFAQEVVRDSLNFWNLGIYEPWAEFTWHETVSCNVEFYAGSNMSFSHYWNFGDTTFSAASNPVHHYMHSGNWNVTHVVYNACAGDTFMLTNNVVCLDGIDEYDANTFELYPDPAGKMLYVEAAGGISIYNLTGKQVLAILPADSGTKTDIDVSSLPEGIYFLNIMDQYGHFSARKFVIAR
jgi:hypothetical protein